MIEKGYPRSFALGVVGASGTIDIVIPPSLALILYGIVAERSRAAPVPRRRTAQACCRPRYSLRPGSGATPQGGAEFPIEAEAPPLAERLRVTARAIPALMVPVIVLVGIYGGVVTVTEAAAIAAVVSLLVSLIYYRGFRWSETLWVVADALKSAGAIMLIVATALAFGHWMTASGVPAELVKWVLAQNMCATVAVSARDQRAVRCVLGCFLEVIATLLAGAADSAQRRCCRRSAADPVHFSIIFYPQCRRLRWFTTRRWA